MRFILLVLLMCLLFCNCNTSNESSDRLFKLINISEAGIEFRNELIYSEDFNIYLYKSFYNGAGVGLGDFNNDGLQDIFFCGNQVDNKLYLNQGELKFRDVTASAKVASSGSWSTGVSIVDINSDGWLDIYVCKSGNPTDKNRRNELFIHTGVLDDDGAPIFKEEAANWGINDLGFSVNATFFDYDKDGDLDMYLLNNSINPTEIVVDAKKGLRDIYDTGGGNKLYKNIGDKFLDVTKEAGIYGSAIGFGLGASVGDVNRDGWLDIYIANDFFEKDYLYYNNQDGTFKEALEASTAEISQGAMGVDIADLTNDGWPEVFVTEMLPNGNKRIKTKVMFDSWDTHALRVKNGYHNQFPRNSLQLNRGIINKNSIVGLSEISRLSGVSATEWSWGVHILDLDNDLIKEIYVTNGIVKDLLDQDYINFYNDADKLKGIYTKKGKVIKELVDNIPSTPVSNFLFKNNGNLKFSDVAKQWGLDTPSFSTGAAFGDLDNDGDLDLVVNNLTTEPFLYENKTDVTNNYINLKLQGSFKNRNAIGSQVTCYVDNSILFQELIPARGTMSTMDNRLNFGLGHHTAVDSIVINWPSGSVSKMYNINSNQFLNISCPTKSSNTNVASIKMPLFSEETTSLTNIPYKHDENGYLDLNRDKLRYNSIATEGPKTAIGDINKDGKPDIFVGGASGQSGTILFGTNDGFTEKKQSVFEADALCEDLGAVLADMDNDGDLDLLVSSGGYEYPSSSFSLANRLYINDGKGSFTKSNQVLPKGKLSDTSCIKTADFDNDGDLDLFVGTRTEPLSYGVPATSYLLRNDGNLNFTNVTNEQAPTLIDLGMVTDAVWVDYDNDNDEDLLVVGEWMSIKLFENENGYFTEKSKNKGLENTNGLWNTIEIADLDNDGDMDFIAGNLGKNTYFKASKEEPLKMYVNDFDGNGKIDQVLGVYENHKLYPMATKSDLTSQMPYLLKKYIKYEDYSTQTISDIFNEKQLNSSIKLITNQTASMVFWNNNGVFEGSELPLEAQLSSVNAILIVDVNNDDIKDVILGGNLFTAKPQTGIYAGSNGTVLLGTSNKTFKNMPYSESGFFVNGEIRDIKYLKIYNGKEIVLIARNNDKIKFFKKNKK